MGYDADASVGMTWCAGHLQSSLAVAVIVIVDLNRKDVSGQSTDQTVRRCVMLLRVLNGVVMRWCPVSDWPSIEAFQAAFSVLEIIIAL